MAFGEKKAEVAALIAQKEAELEHLRQENAWLREKIDKLQDALIAKESPVAYQHMQMDKAAAEWDATERPPVDMEERVRELNILKELFYRP